MTEQSVGTLDFHRGALSKMCRICAQLISSSKNISKISKHKEAVLAVYNLDTDSDNEGIHPASICNKCRLSVRRAYGAMQSGKSFEGTLPTLNRFSAHQPFCSLCNKYTAHLQSIQPGVKIAAAPVPTPSTSTQEPDMASATRALFSETSEEAKKRPKRVWDAKESLKDVRRDYAKKRTKEAGDFIDAYCARQKENKTDLLYFLLTEDLRDCSDDRFKEVMSSWGHELSRNVSADDCLAMRISTMTSKRKYKQQYRQLKSAGKDILKPPHVLDELEKSYMPGSVRFQLEGGTDLIHHTPVKAGSSHIEYGHLSFEPSVVGRGGIFEGLELPIPNFKAVEWSYAHALAKTLEELDEDIAAGLEKCGVNPHGDQTIITTVKDGADGLGDVSVMKEASDRFLPDKAFRSAFAVIKCEVEIEAAKRVVVYEPKNPNSVLITRPLLEAIADENNGASSVAMLDAMEHSREVLKTRRMRVHANGWWREHQFIFYNSMIDEKLDRAEGGLQGSGSKFLCTLCHATRETARSDVGSFNITRTYEDTLDTSNYIQTNPDNLSQADLAECAKGVKDYPVLRSDPDHKLIDATHADINLGSFFKKLIICEVARTFTWEITRDVKPMYEDAEKQFDTHMRATIGRKPSLMMTGNYARDLFDAKSTDTILGIIPNEERRQHLSEVMGIFRELRKVYRAHHPSPADIDAYKRKAVHMGELLKTNFAYAAWPNYLHKVIEHVQEVLKDPRGPGTIGGLSGEGNEGANKIFRDMRLHLSRKNSTIDSLRDILWMHWLYTSPKLQRLAQVVNRAYKCAHCGETGHNILTCQELDHCSDDSL